MNTRAEALTDEFTLWLDRYSPRRALQANEQAMSAEVNALMRVILKMAPGSDYLSWLAKVTNQLDYQMKTAAWPTVSEVGAACSNINKAKALHTQRKFPSLDPVAIAAKRMNAGEDIADGWLYGRGAVELIKSGAVSRETIRKYRSALFFAYRDLLGEEKAKLREADFIARHEAAERLDAAKTEPPKGEPFKRMPTSPDDQYADVYRGAFA